QTFQAFSSAAGCVILPSKRSERLGSLFLLGGLTDQKPDLETLSSVSVSVGGPNTPVWTPFGPRFSFKRVSNDPFCGTGTTAPGGTGLRHSGPCPRPGRPGRTLISAPSSSQYSSASRTWRRSCPVPAAIERSHW